MAKTFGGVEIFRGLAWQKNLEGMVEKSFLGWGGKLLFFQESSAKYFWVGWQKPLGGWKLGCNFGVGCQKI